jgi:hypothetical protein
MILEIVTWGFFSAWGWFGANYIKEQIWPESQPIEVTAEKRNTKKDANEQSHEQPQTTNR